MNERLSELYRAYAAALLSKEHAKSGDYAHPVFGEGKTNAALMLVGEAPGGEEAKQGHPFVGAAGKQLDALLAGAGIDRAEVFVTNAVKYRPTNVKAKSVSNRTPLQTEIAQGLPLLQNEIELISPKVIATLGNTPLSALLRLAGEEKRTVGELHGKAVKIGIDGNVYTLFALYHPASVIYNRALRPVLEADIIALSRILKEGVWIEHEA